MTGTIVGALVFLAVIVVLAYLGGFLWYRVMTTVHIKLDRAFTNAVQRSRR